MESFVASQWKKLTNVEMEAISELCVIPLWTQLYRSDACNFMYFCSDGQSETRLAFSTSQPVRPACST